MPRLWTSLLCTRVYVLPRAGVQHCGYSPRSVCLLCVDLMSTFAPTARGARAPAPPAATAAHRGPGTAPRTASVGRQARGPSVRVSGQGRGALLEGLDALRQPVAFALALRQPGTLLQGRYPGPLRALAAPAPSQRGWTRIVVPWLCLLAGHRISRHALPRHPTPAPAHKGRFIENQVK